MAYRVNLIVFCNPNSLQKYFAIPKSHSTFHYFPLLGNSFRRSPRTLQTNLVIRERSVNKRKRYKPVLSSTNGTKKISRAFSF